VLEPEPDVELIPPAAQAEPVVDGLEDEVVHKITKQVELKVLALDYMIPTLPFLHMKS